jgi:hypothetical protein
VSKILDRVADAGGILHVLLVFGGFAFLVAPHLPPSLDEPDAVLAHLQAHPPTTAFWAGLWLEGAGLAVLVLLAARIASRIRSAQADSWIPAAVVGLAVAAATVKIGSFAPALAALEIDRFDAPTVTALLSINDAAVPVAGALDGGFVLLLGLGALAVLPRWLSALTVLAGLGTLLSVAVPALDLLLLLFYVWLLTVSGWLLARGGRTATTAPESAIVV